ncbi:hypothetical protein [Staphylococcus shinii]|uniref:hypothetical protein n=1 Tax=Staphylococcus shinii TaxID=2912228 RepID=UPI003F83A5CA
MNKTLDKIIEKIDIKKEMIDKELPLLIDVQDFSAFNISDDLNTESIEIDDEDRIKAILEFIKKYADISNSPQSLFTVAGISYNTYTINLKKPYEEDNESIISLDKQKAIVEELLSILEKQSFSINTENIINIEISTPDKNSRHAKADGEFYLSYFLLNSDQPIKHNGNVYTDELGQDLGMILHFKLFDENDEEISLEHEGVFTDVADVIDIKFNEQNYQSNYFDFLINLNEAKLKSPNNKDISNLKITSVEYHIVLNSNEDIILNEEEFRNVINDNKNNINIDIIHSVADGITFNNPNMAK